LRLVVVEESARGHPGIGGDGRHRGAGQPVFEHAGDRGLVEGAAGLPGLLRAQGFVNWHETILHSMQVFTKCNYAIVHYFTVCRIPMGRDAAARLTSASSAWLDAARGSGAGARKSTRLKSSHV